MDHRPTTFRYTPTFETWGLAPPPKDRLQNPCHHCWLWLHVQQSTLLTTPNHTHQWWVITAWNTMKIEVEEGKLDQDYIENKQIFLLKNIHIWIITHLLICCPLWISNNTGPISYSTASVTLHSVLSFQGEHTDDSISVFSVDPYLSPMVLYCMCGMYSAVYLGAGRGGVGVKWSHHWVMKLFLFQASNYSHQ